MLSFKSLLQRNLDETSQRAETNHIKSQQQQQHGSYCVQKQRTFYLDI